MSTEVSFGGDATGHVRPSTRPDRIAHTPTEVAEMLGLTAQTVYRMIHNGDIVARRVGVRSYRILDADLQKYLDGAIEPAKDPA